MAACDDPINGIRAGAAGAARLAPSIRQLVNEVRGADRQQAAQVLQGDLATGNKSGYTFAIVNCTKVTVNNQDMYTSYEATAVPQAVGKTGHRGFCIDQAGETRGTWHQCTYAVHVAFDDSARDPGVDPDLVL